MRKLSFQKAESLNREKVDPFAKAQTLPLYKDIDKIASQLGYKTQQKPENLSLIDMLISELVTLRSGTFGKPISSPNILELLARASTKEERPPSRTSSPGKDVPEKINDNNVVNAVISPKNRRGSIRGLNRTKQLPHEVIAETHEEGNAQEDDYDNDFESITMSQSLGNLPTFKRPEPLGKIRSVESVDESYPEDFDQLSAASASQNFSSRIGMKYNNKGANRDDDSKDIFYLFCLNVYQDISEDFQESVSRSALGNFKSKLFFG